MAIKKIKKIKLHKTIAEKPFQQYNETKAGNWVACYDKFVIPIRDIDTADVVKIRESLSLSSLDGVAEDIYELNRIAKNYDKRKVAITGKEKDKGIFNIF